MVKGSVTGNDSSSAIGHATREDLVTTGLDTMVRSTKKNRHEDAVIKEAKFAYEKCTHVRYGFLVPSGSVYNTILVPHFRIDTVRPEPHSRRFDNIALFSHLDHACVTKSEMILIKYEIRNTPWWPPARDL